MSIRTLMSIFLAISLSAAGFPASALQTEAPWTGAADFIPPYETTPGYQTMRLGGWGGDELDHTPRRDGQVLDHLIVFVHGNSGDASTWDEYRTYYRDRGFNDSALWAISWAGGSIRDLWWNQFTEENSTDLTLFLEAVAVYTGVSNVRLVAHSQGAILVKDMLFEHRPAGVSVTRFTTIASPHGDKTSPDDSGAAVCLDPDRTFLDWCILEFGTTAQAQAWRDARVVTDLSVTAIQVIYSGTTSDATFYRNEEEDCRFSPRDNVASGTWPGSLVHSQHGDQDHRELRDLNTAEVFSFITDPVCGDGEATGGEVCDGGDLAGQDCVSRGYSGGELLCNGSCDGFDESGCYQGEVCGDGWCAGAASGEDCYSCAADCPGRVEGAPKKRYCCGDGTCESGKEDLASCPIDCGGSPPVCGNDTIEGVEECDGADLGGETCVSLGYDCGGALVCLPDCTYDTSGCSASTCGDDNAECGETCDGTDLEGMTCALLGFEGGDLSCSSTCDAFDTSGCTGGPLCGDGLCEGSALGEDCHSCPADCPGKTNGKPSGRYCCGNGTCEPAGENDVNCPADCL